MYLVQYTVLAIQIVRFSESVGRVQPLVRYMYVIIIDILVLLHNLYTVWQGSSYPPEKKNLIYLRYFRLNIILLQSKIILGHMNSIG